MLLELTTSKNVCDVEVSPSHKSRGKINILPFCSVINIGEKYCPFGEDFEVMGKASTEKIKITKINRKDNNFYPEMH